MPKKVGTAILVVLVVAGVLGACALAVWLLPVLLTEHPHLTKAAARYKAEADIRTGLVALLAVLGALGGLYYTGRTFRLSQETNRLSAEGQITDRYSKAVDQLGDDSPEISLGGIYALGRIMRDSPPDEQAVVAVLSAFVRRKAKRNDNLDVPWSAEEAERDEVKPSFRIQAALNVISNREHRDMAAVPDLRDSDLRGARLKDAQLREGSFRRSYLYKAHLISADLRAASLVDADLTGARLAGAKLAGADLSRVRLTVGALSQEQREAAMNTDKIIWVSAETGKDQRGREPRGQKRYPYRRLVRRFLWSPRGSKPKNP